MSLNISINKAMYSQSPNRLFRHFLNDVCYIPSRKVSPFLVQKQTKKRQNSTITSVCFKKNFMCIHISMYIEKCLEE